MTNKEAIQYLQQLYPNGGHCWLDEQRIEAISMAIDALQEEPVSEDLKEASKEWLSPQLDKSYAAYGERKMMELTHFDGYAMLDAIEFGAQWQQAKDESTTEDLGDYINELSKQFPDVSFAKLSRIAVRVSRWQRNQDVKNKLPKVINRTDLDEYAYQCAYDMSNDWMIENPTWKDVEDACKLGAKWQKQQDQSTIELAEDHAMLAGMEKMKEELMAKAKGGTVQKDYQIIMDDGTYIDLDPSMSLKPSLAVKEGERIKVILIKEG